MDGFSLFYGALTRSAFKWLDLFALFQSNALAPEVQVEQVRYYTARIKAAACDDPEAAARQQIYWAALRAHCGDLIHISEGRMQKSTPRMRLAEAVENLPKLTAVKVLRFTEKKTDVNLAADLVSDAWAGRMEQAVICSDDSDLAGALAAVRRDVPSVRIGLVCPRLGKDQPISKDLSASAHWHKFLSVAHLERAQLPEKIRGTPLVCPGVWRSHSD